MQPSECARAAGGRVGWLAICYSSRQLRTRGVTPCPLSAWGWTGHLFHVARRPSLVLGPEMTPHLPPRSPGYEKITPSPPGAQHPVVSLGGRCGLGGGGSAHRSGCVMELCQTAFLYSYPSLNTSASS